MRTSHFLLAILPLSVLLGTGCGDENREAGIVPGEDAESAMERQILNVGPPGEEVQGSIQGDDILVTWTESHPGDFNSDGLVNGMDVFPLAANFQEDVPGNPGNECIDGNGDGTLTGLDLFVISANFNRRIDGYNVWSSAEETGPFDRLENISLVGYIGCSAENMFLDPDPAIPIFYVIRAYDQIADEESADSEVAGVTTEPDLEAPLWYNRVGALAVSRTDDTATVYWDSAYDEDSPPVEYLFGYSEDLPLWEVGDYSFIIPNPQDGGPDYDWKHSHTIPDWGTKTYYFGIRAKDAAEPPNVEQNNVSVTPDTFPPTWDSTVGVQQLISWGDGTVSLYFNGATDSISPPVAYNTYVDNETPIRFGDGAYGRRVPTGSPGDYEYRADVEGLEFNSPYYFAVRAEDSAFPPVEDQNTEENGFTLAGPVNEIISTDTSLKAYIDTVRVNQSDYVFYRDLSNNRLAALYYDAGSWNSEVVNSGAGAGNYVDSVVPELSGIVVLCAAYNSQEGSLEVSSRYATGWVTAIADGDGPEDVGRFCRVSLDPWGEPVFSYIDDTNKNLKFAYIDAQGVLRTEVVAFLGNVPQIADGTNAIAWDSDELPVIAFRHDESGEIRLAKRDKQVKDSGPGEWGQLQVSDNGMDNRLPQFIIPPSGTPFIAWTIPEVDDEVIVMAHYGGEWTEINSHDPGAPVRDMDLVSTFRGGPPSPARFVTLSIALQDANPVMLKVRQTWRGADPVFESHLVEISDDFPVFLSDRQALSSSSDNVIEDLYMIDGGGFIRKLSHQTAIIPPGI